MVPSYIISAPALQVLKALSEHEGSFKGTYEVIYHHIISNDSFFSGDERAKINACATQRDYAGLMGVYTERINLNRTEAGRLAGQKMLALFLRILSVCASIAAFMTGTAALVFPVVALSVVNYLRNTRTKSPWILSCMAYVVFLIFYTSSLWQILVEWIFIPLKDAVCSFVELCLRPFSDLFKGLWGRVTRSWGEINERLFKRTAKPETDSSSTNTTQPPPECPQPPGFSCEFKDFLDSVGGVRGMAMMFGLFGKVLLAVNGTFMIGNASSNVPVLASHDHALLPPVVRQEMFHQNLAHDLLLTHKFPLNLADMGSKFEIQVAAMVEKALVKERKGVATMIAAAIVAERKRAADEQNAKASSAVPPVFMSMAYGVVWEIGRYALFRTMRWNGGGNPRTQLLLQVVRLGMSTAPLIYNQHAVVVAGGAFYEMGQHTVNGLGVGALVYSGMGFIAKIIYDYALVPMYVRDYPEPVAAASEAAGGGASGVNPAGDAAAGRWAAPGTGPNIHSISTAGTKAT